MQDENKTPVSEPQEVVGQYIRDDSREVTDCYVHRDPLPAAAPEPLNHGLDIYIIYKYRTHRIEDLL